MIALSQFPRIRSLMNEETFVSQPKGMPYASISGERLGSHQRTGPMRKKVKWKNGLYFKWLELAVAV